MDILSGDSTTDEGRVAGNDGIVGTGSDAKRVSVVGRRLR